MMELLHVGVPVKTPQKGEVYAEDMKLHIAPPETNDFKIEYLRFDEDSEMPAELKNNVHVAYKVDDVHKYIADNKVIIAPMTLPDGNVMAFIEKDGLIVELLQCK